MSKFFAVEIVDSPVYVKLHTLKNTNLEYIRTRFLKYGAPAGTMKLQILNEAKTVIIAESESINCNYTTDLRYVGTDGTYNMSWIRFAFNGEANRTGLNYYVKLLPDAAYFSGRDANNHLCTIKDYPKPTNSDTLEAAEGYNFSRYPDMVLQVFGRDFG